MMETLHYILIIMQMIVILLMLYCMAKLWADSKGLLDKRVKEVTREDYEQWKKENNVR